MYGGGDARLEDSNYRFLGPGLELLDKGVRRVTRYQKSVVGLKEGEEKGKSVCGGEGGIGLVIDTDETSWMGRMLWGGKIAVV